jgi:hypothetical protein
MESTASRGYHEQKYCGRRNDTMITTVHTNAASNADDPHISDCMHRVVQYSYHILQENSAVRRTIRGVKTVLRQLSDMYVPRTLTMFLAVVLMAFCTAAQAQSTSPFPDAPSAAAAANPAKMDKPAIVNGRPYVRPTAKDQFEDYLRDSYGIPAIVRTTVGAVYGQGIDSPSVWGQDWRGFGQRMGWGTASTIVNGNVRYGMETAFHEDMRYIPCHGCSAKKKIENALLAEVTARHDSDGHRFFTLTPLFSDMTGPILVNSFAVPGKGPINGVIGSRVRITTRIGGHLYREFVMERKHHDPKLPD